MPDAHYENYKLAEIYDLDSPWSIDRDFYLSLAASVPQKILDLGCGTGLLCNAYAQKGHDVTGIDPSRTMLDIAHQKSNGKRIEWVQSSAQNYNSEKSFDLIIMTGHAFQVLLENSDVLATFEVIKNHLKPSGRFVFESRNPYIDWPKKWDYDMVFESPKGTVKETRRFLKIENNKMTFELNYQFPDEKLVSNSMLRFWTYQEINNHLISSKLCIDEILGDWDGKAFDEHSSHEMIFIIKLAL